MIALILGGAPSVWTELATAKAMLGAGGYVVVAANLAGRDAPDRIDAWASLHSDLIAGWAADRKGNADFRAFAPTRHPDALAAEIVPERWAGSSGLYAAQVALYEVGASAAILCGVPMDSSAGHFAIPGPWASTTSYRRAFEAALPAIGGRVRSMGGWTSQLFGRPEPEWIEAVSTLRPLGRTQPKRRPMFTVTNNSNETKRFNEEDPNGGFRLVRLAPGESGQFEINPNQAIFQRGELTVTPAKEPETLSKRAKADAKAEHRILAQEPETNATGPSGASSAE
jgi:hypothetical protein